MASVGRMFDAIDSAEEAGMPAQLAIDRINAQSAIDRINATEQACYRASAQSAIFVTLGIATATEHSALVLGGNIVSDRPGHRVFSIGSVKISQDVSNGPVTRVVAKMQDEIHSRLHLPKCSMEFTAAGWNSTQHGIHCRRMQFTVDSLPTIEMGDDCSRKSWSGTIEAISRCVAAYERAANAYEISNCEDIMSKLLRYVQSLLQKCVSNVYLRQHVTSIITDYIWNRCCNVALRMLLDDIVTSGKRSTTSSQQDLNYTVDLLEHCADYLKTYSDEILTELLYYRSATEQAVRHRHS